MRILLHQTACWLLSFLYIFPIHLSAGSGGTTKKIHVIAFYTAREDPAHISFVHEANHWFSVTAARYGFTYDATSQWDQLNESFLKDYQMVIFLDSRPEAEAQRTAFRKYMEHGGAWMGFHFNMGHNDIDYEHGNNRELSSTFSSEWQNRMVGEAVRWLGEASSKSNL